MMVSFIVFRYRNINVKFTYHYHSACKYSLYVIFTFHYLFFFSSFFLYIEYEQRWVPLQKCENTNVAEGTRYKENGNYLLQNSDVETHKINHIFTTPFPLVYPVRQSNHICYIYSFFTRILHYTRWKVTSIQNLQLISQLHAG